MMEVGSNSSQRILKGQAMVNLHDFELYTQQNLDRNGLDYYHSGANDMITLKANRSIYNELCLLPRVLRDVSQINLSTTLLGERISMPICIAPSAAHGMAHPDAERATSRAAARMNILMTLSSMSTTSLEEVASAADALVTTLHPTDTITAHPPRWYQLYVYRDRKITEMLVTRAIRAGYTAIIVTVDAPKLGRREADIRNRFAFPNHLTLANLQGEEYQNVMESSSIAIQIPHSSTAQSSKNSALATFFTQQIDDSLTWESIIPFLQQYTIPANVKIVVKGILLKEDVHRAYEVGVDAIWISNHGARQLDTTPASLEVLPEIVATCQSSSSRKVNQEIMEVYLDGGIMRGTEVIKALALGARAVFIGRPILWGLTYDGEEGVCQVLTLLREELTLAMKLLGCTDVHVSCLFSFFFQEF
jgi:isopentenyl diphosphate isomerase/L-lactate dehydrogenase-like FMN-dependent dehydrogenase